MSYPDADLSHAISEELSRTTDRLRAQEDHKEDRWWQVYCAAVAGSRVQANGGRHSQAKAFATYVHGFTPEGVK